MWCYVSLRVILGVLSWLLNSLVTDAFAFNPLLATCTGSRSIAIGSWAFSLSPPSPAAGRFSGGPSSVCLNLAAGSDADSINDEDDDDDDDDDPLADGIDAVAWLPSVKEKQKAEVKSDDVEILPLFPLGVHTPQSNQVLNIFEPRYRQMYNDILMNGSKRFVVTMCHPTQQGKFAEIGVIFQLEDLKEVSELTGDQVKYICDHRVTDRVKIHRILNPEVHESRETYLKVEATRLKEEGDDNAEKTKTTIIKPLDVYIQIAKAVTGGADEQLTEEENRLRKSFATLVKLQYDLQEDVRFTNASVDTLKVKSGSGKDSLWETVRLWQSYSDNRMQSRQSELQQEFQEKLLKFLEKKKKEKEEKIPSVIDFSSLSPELQKDVQELEKRMTMELKPLALESTLAMQKILEGETHTKRVKTVRYFVEAECKRLKAKTALLGMFSSSSSAEELEEDKSNKESRSSTNTSNIQSSGGSILFDEPDAFQ